ncbi:MAG: peptide chain release factor N(5)-glutamine methyltransferase [Planctomycetia bacterium]|nr:peptide chain release factor N(5)-glutamine methyltransferase [Planctomycetia bacterium]
MSQSEAWTVQRLLEWTTDYLKKHGSEASRLEAEILLAHSLSLKRIELYTNFDEIPDEKALARFRDLVKRRGSGEPVAYLTGYKEFYSLDFEVNSAVLIPRPETEQIVLEVVELIKKRKETDSNSTFQILDIGTGSGNIAIALAKNLPGAELTAVDISEKALELARKNAKKHKMEDRIHFIQSDLFSALDLTREFDIIVSNPPYVKESEYRNLDPMVRNFEPKEALLAGPDGTEIIFRLVRDAVPFLKKGGKILIEMSPMIIHQVGDFMREDPHWGEIQILRDFARLERIIVAVRSDL